MWEIVVLEANSLEAGIRLLHSISVLLMVLIEAFLKVILYKGCFFLCAVQEKFVFCL